MKMGWQQSEQTKIRSRFWNGTYSCAWLLV